MLFLFGVVFVSAPPTESNGYLRVRCNGGLNQQRSAVCTSVSLNCSRLLDSLKLLLSICIALPATLAMVPTQGSYFFFLLFLENKYALA